jgi:hypothetical protein
MRSRRHNSLATNRSGLATMNVPKWSAQGHWFDVCACNIGCPCEFGQAPTFDECDGVLAWHITKGRYGDVVLDGLSVLGLAYFKGNIWAGAAASVGLFIDERGSAAQRQALQAIFGGQAGGWPKLFAQNMQVRGIEFAPIEYSVAENLSTWRAAIPGKVEAQGAALGGPTTPKGALVQMTNAPGSETGPGGTVTWGVSKADTVDHFGFKWTRSGQSSKHIPFDWSGPD